MELALKDLQERRDALEAEINALSSRKQQLETELKANFAGQSDAIARRVKGFQEYLGGALQDLVQSVENLELVVQPMVVQPSPSIRRQTTQRRRRRPGGTPPLQRPLPTPFAPTKNSSAVRCSASYNNQTSTPIPGTCGAASTPRTSPYWRTGSSTRGEEVHSPAAAHGPATSWPAQH